MGARQSTVQHDTTQASEATFPKNANDELFFGADYNPEQWSPDVWEEDVKLMREVISITTTLTAQAKVNVVSIAIFSWALIEVSDNQWDFDWLDRIIALLHHNGIAVDLGTATASPPPWLTTAHPEILPANQQGQTLSPGSRQHWRPTSAVFRRYALRLTSKLAERYGKHPAVVAWHVNNELGCAHAHEYSEEAATAFRGWLRRRYTSIENLNSAWGTAFWSQRYNHFEEILPPRIAPTFINPTQQLDWARFSSDALNDYLQAEREVLHRLSPGVPVTTNYMLARQTKGMDVARWGVDFVSNDHYRYPSREYDTEELSFSASLTSGVAGSRPWWLMEHSTSAVNWQSVNPAKQRGGLIRDSLTHVAHGADAVCFFQWRQSRSGAEKYHSSMIPHAGPNSKIFRDVVTLGKTLRDLSEIKGSHKATAPIAILWDWESWVSAEFDGHPSTLIDYPREALEWFVALLNLGFRVDVIPSHSKISDYKLVIAPILYLVNDDLQKKIREFTCAGGHFVTTYFSGIVDKNDHVRLGGYPGAFTDILGIRVEEWQPLMDHETVRLDDGTCATIWSEKIDIIDDSVRVLRRYTSGDLEGQAAVTMLSRGTSSSTYVSTRLGVAGLEKILPDILLAAGLESTLPQSLRGRVEQVLRTNGVCTWKFLINRTSETLDLGEVQGQRLGPDSSARTLAPQGVAIYRTSS